MVMRLKLSKVDSAAQTYCNRIYVKDSYQSGNRDQLLLLAHELRHAQQCTELGGEGKFGFHYFREYKRAGHNYENNSLEKSAEERASTIARSVPNELSSELIAQNQVADAQSARLRPEYNGRQLRDPDNGKIFWVDRGQIRHILNPSVYQNIFVPKTQNAIDLVSITEGSPVNSDNRLVCCGESNHSLKNRIYFLDGGQKRHILSPSVMNKNSFDWNKVRTIDCPALAGIPDGETIK
jgi:hypothetical protein